MLDLSLGAWDRVETLWGMIFNSNDEVLSKKFQIKICEKNIFFPEPPQGLSLPVCTILYLRILEEATSNLIDRFQISLKNIDPF